MPLAADAISSRLTFSSKALRATSLQLICSSFFILDFSSSGMVTVTFGNPSSLLTLGPAHSLRICVFLHVTGTVRRVTCQCGLVLGTDNGNPIDIQVQAHLWRPRLDEQQRIQRFLSLECQYVVDSVRDGCEEDEGYGERDEAKPLTVYRDPGSPVVGR